MIPAMLLALSLAAERPPTVRPAYVFAPAWISDVPAAAPLAAPAPLAPSIAPAVPAALAAPVAAAAAPERPAPAPAAALRAAASPAPALAAAAFDGAGPRLLVEANLPDPAAVRAQGAYYLTGTSNRAPDAFPLFKSADLKTWERTGHIFPAGSRPAWTKPDGFFWAPEIHRVGKRYVAYYTAEDRAGKLALGAAWARSPEGPWTDLGRPMLESPRVGLIDSHHFRDSDGRRYLYWKEDSNGLAPKEPTGLFVRELTPDGLGFVGEARRLLENDLDWEGDLIEGPWVVKRRGWYYLIYSANAFFDGRYAVGAARSRSPLGPFVKKGAPILRTSDEWIGPGHGMVLRIGGKDHYVYHAWRPGRAGGLDLFTSALEPPYPAGEHPRVPLIRRLRWRGGWPALGPD